MDDEATFHDFADKLDADFCERFEGERLDVICHSTAAVVRGWFACAPRGQSDAVSGKK